MGDAPTIDEAVDLSGFEADVAQANGFVDEQRVAARAAADRGEAREEDDRLDPTLLSMDDINREGNRIARSIESTTLRLRLQHQIAQDFRSRYEEARAKALLGLHAPTKGEREALADSLPPVAALKDALHYAEIAVDVAQRACTNLGRILDWRTAQLYKASKLVDR